jgi:AbiTii
MSEPLILQIQQATLDSSSSLTDTLRRSKIACAKLGLADFGKWVEQELTGYTGKGKDLPPYRRPQGTAELFNPFHGWLTIGFPSGTMEDSWTRAYVAMSVPSMEDSLSRLASKPGGVFVFPYAAEMKRHLLDGMQGASDVRLRVEASQIAGLLQHVRDILLDWTLEMEKQGVLGEGLTFSAEERAKSKAPTAEAISHVYNIENVGTLVQSADRSIIQGGVNVDLMQQADHLAERVEKLLPAAIDLPEKVRAEAAAAIAEIKEATASRDEGRVRKSLAFLRRALAPAGEHLVRIAVDQVVAKMTGQ